METWKAIPDYENYQVSDLGNVRSMSYRRTGETKVLTPKRNNCGRMWVDLKGKPTLVHRLVATVFLPNPQGLPEINHKDGNPANNAVENLEWCTGEYNKREYFKGIDKGTPRKLFQNILQISMDGNVIARWDNVRQITVETGMNQWSITQCCDGKRKTAYGFRWQYAI